MVKSVEKRIVSGLPIVDKVDIFDTHQDALGTVLHSLKVDRPVILSFMNAHAFNLCYSDDEFRDALMTSDVVLRDGVGMEMLFKSIGIDPGLNLNGTDFIPVLLKKLKEKSIALFGTEDMYLLKAATKLASDGHAVLIAEDGFQEFDHYVRLAMKLRPSMVILAMGMPKQEKLAAYLREQLKHNCLIVNGGAILDFIAGKIERAPQWIQRIRMEWAFRFLKEPKRLFNRYVVGNLVFIRRIMHLRKKVGKLTAPEMATQP